MDFRILGPFEVRADDRPLALGAPRQRALLALLLLRANLVVSVDELIDQLWGEEPPPAAANTVQTYVSRLRRVFAEGGDGPDRLETRTPGYVLHVEPGDIDAERFARLAADGRAALRGNDPLRAADRLRVALGEWRGPALADFVYEPFAGPEIARLDRHRLTALEDRIEADLALGRHAELADELAALVEAEPLRERFWELRLVALHRSGRRAEALQAFDRAREVFWSELDVEPGPELTRIADAVRAGEPGAVPGPDDERPDVLPIIRTSFVGREADLADVGRLVDAGHLVTLVGSAGCGKTRLAIEVARRRLEASPDRVGLVELAGLTDPRLVPRAVASTLGLHVGPGIAPVDAVAATLCRRRLLLILDNCEHVLDAAASLVARLLESCPDVRVLATSQEPLGIAGEQVYPIAPLSTPVGEVSVESLLEAPATRLFVDRASAAMPGFDVGPSDAATIARICARLDGIPLAIELAATRVRLLDLAELERRLDDRFSLLTNGDRAGPARHRTLEATIDWSHGLLSGPEQALFARLAVFAGGFTLEAAEAVCPSDDAERATVLGTLGRLVDRSLVNRSDGPSGAVRFGLLETIRAYASDRLVGAPGAAALRARHAECFTELAETAAVRLPSPDQGAWLLRLRLEQDNIRSAISWSIGAGRRETALRLAYALWLYWELDGSPAEGVRWLEAALESVASVPEVLRAKARVAAGFMALDIGEHDRAKGHALAAVEMSERTGDAHGVAMARHLLGAVAMFTGDQRLASTELHAALDRFRDLGDRLNVAWTLHHIGQMLRMEGRFASARSAHEESLELYRLEGAELRTAYALWRLGIVAGHLDDDRTAAARCGEALALFTAMDDASGVAHVTATMGDLARIGGDIVAASDAYVRSLATFKELCDRRCIASSLKNLGVTAQARGDRSTARGLFEESLRLRIELNDPAGIAECLAGMAGLELSEGRADEAARLLGAAAAMRSALGVVPWMGDEQALADDAASARAALGPEGFESAWQAGGSLDRDAAVELALSSGAPTSA
jgi:predicted ATPase/DNA-binding SARP family transcriptional activator